MISDQLFARLRALTTAELTDARLSNVPRTLIPIEQTVDGWFCVDQSGQVVHVRDTDGAIERVTDDRTATALIGSLSRVHPLATVLLPNADDPVVCGHCDGTGRPSELPRHLRRTIVCACGGLGWLVHA